MSFKPTTPNSLPNVVTTAHMSVINAGTEVQYLENLHFNAKLWHYFTV
jgi:hypothetical protein